jgi:hypothetical protein
MARSTQNDPRRESTPDVERALNDRAEIEGFKENPIGRSGAAQETLNIGHACLRNECWPGTSAASGAEAHAAASCETVPSGRSAIHLTGL